MGGAKCEVAEKLTDSVFMEPLDILVAHPQKHHVYHLAAGCVKSGLNTQLLVPLYRKGMAASLARLPGPIGRRAQGYHYPGLPEGSVSSSVFWQIKRLLVPAADLVAFQYRFDAWVAARVRRGEMRPKVLVTMQYYMPATVSACKA